MEIGKGFQEKKFHGIPQLIWKNALDARSVITFVATEYMLGMKRRTNQKW